MLYNKPALHIREQIDLLEARGLTIDDKKKAENYLSNIGYYRLRAYTYPFQDNDNPDHPFKESVSFEQIVDRYIFDRKLRVLLLDALEKIEVSLRTQIIYNFSIEFGPFWYTDRKHFTDETFHERNLKKLRDTLKNSSEVFIKHYKKTYSSPVDPPAWMSFEVCSLGLLSKFFANTRKGEVKRAITRYYDLKSEDVLVNWFTCLTFLRNVCAHHGRVFNRRFSKLRIPKKSSVNSNPWQNATKFKLYSYLCVVVFLLDVISPQHNFRASLRALLHRFDEIEPHAMGFPSNWKSADYLRLKG